MAWQGISHFMREERAVQTYGSTCLGSHTYLIVVLGPVPESPHLSRSVSILYTGGEASEKHVEINLCHHIVPCLVGTADSKTWAINPCGDYAPFASHLIPSALF